MTEKMLFCDLYDRHIISNHACNICFCKQRDFFIKNINMFLTKPNLYHFWFMLRHKMREMRKEVGKKTLKKEMDFYYVTGIKSGTDWASSMWRNRQYPKSLINQVVRREWFTKIKKISMFLSPILYYVRNSSQKHFDSMENKWRTILDFYIMYIL